MAAEHVRERLTQQGDVAGILAQPESLEEERESEMVLPLVLVALCECCRGLVS
jgi:hypothetical protein